MCNGTENRWHQPYLDNRLILRTGRFWAWVRPADICGWEWFVRNYNRQPSAWRGGWAPSVNVAMRMVADAIARYESEDTIDVVVDGAEA